MEKTVFLAPLTQVTPLNRLLATVFPRYKVLLELEKEPEHLRGTLRNLILTHDRRLMFLRNQKCACTQTTQLLYAYSNSGETYRGNIHRANHGIIPGRYRWPDIKPVLEGQMAYLFTFVRHPETRILSAFHNFFVDQKNIARHKHLGPMRTHGYDPLRDAAWNFDVFLDYVAHGFEIDPLRSDSHWRRQVDNIGFAYLSFDHIGRVENYAEDIRAVFGHGDPAGFPSDALLAKKVNESTSGRYEITAPQRRRIEELFAQDYSAFGY